MSAVAAGALAAAHAALDRSAAGADVLGYTSEAGVPPLRQAGFRV